MVNMDNEMIDLYGQGWKFPLAFQIPSDPLDDANSANGVPGGVVMSAGANNVEQSLRVLFQTQPGERLMRGMYGCDLQSVVFANLSEGMLGSLRSRIAQSIARNEPRTEVLAIDLQQDTTRTGWLGINVTYRLAGQAQTRRFSGTLDIRDGMGGGF